MSIWTYKKAVMKSSLDAQTKLVLLALDMHVNDMGDPAFPSFATLVELTSLARSTVIDRLNHAEKAGWFVRERRPVKGARNQTNLYYLQVPHHLYMASNAGPFNDESGEPDRVRQPDPEGPQDGPSQSATRTQWVRTADPELTNGINHRNNKPQERARALPDDFAVTDKHREWAAANGLPSPDGEFEAFCDHHRAKGSTFKDWDAALRTWMRNAARFSSPRSATSQISDQRRRKLCEMNYAGGIGTNGRLL